MTSIRSSLAVVLLAIVGDVAEAENSRRLWSDNDALVGPRHNIRHYIQPRDTATAAATTNYAPTQTVDFGSMPTCGISNCIYPSSSTTYPCPTTYPAPCPSGDGKDCSTVSLDCYCQLATPYQCAFHPCSWPNVMLLENWFNKTCPNTNPGVNYDYEVGSTHLFVPSCARDCLSSQMISYGCTSESRNCFCSHGYLFGCTALCSQSDNSTIADWLAATCQISNKAALETVANDVTGDSEAKSGGPNPPTPPPPLSWYEILAIVIFAVSTAVSLIYAAYKEWKKKVTETRTRPSKPRKKSTMA